MVLWGKKRQVKQIKQPPTHMVQTRPHHVKLVHELFVQGTHLWVHQLLVDSQAHSQDVDLQRHERQNLV